MHRRPCRTRWLLALAAPFVLWPALVSAWGSRGHELVNDQAIGLLPVELRPFFERHRADLVRLATEPDRRKLTDPEERPRHYLDIDAAGAPNEYPRTLEDAIKRFGVKVATKHGVLPWHIAALDGDLAAAFKARDEARIIDIAGRLGHYVGDSFVPLHSSLNFDGQLTGNEGIHALWETELIERFPFHETMKPFLGTVAVLDDPLKFTFDTLLAGNAEVAGILRADNDLKPLRGRPEYFDKLRERCSELASRRLGEAATATASHWYTAWVKADRPELPAAAPVPPAGDGAGGGPGPAPGGEPARKE